MNNLTLLIPAKEESGSLPLVLDELKKYNCKKLVVLDEKDIITIDSIKNYLIVGIGLNTNVVPKNKSFSSTSLKNIVNKKIENKKILKKIKDKYEKLLLETKKFSFIELRNKYKRLK